MLLSEARKKYLAERAWRYHAPTGFWWKVRLGRKWRSHETVLARFDRTIFRFVVDTPELSGCASVPA